MRKTPWWVWLLPLPIVWWAALAVACRWQPGMKITALLDALNSALAEPFALAWSQDSPRFLLVFTVIYAVVLIVAVSDQKNTRPGAEHGSAAWGEVFRLNKFYMDTRGPNLLLTQHFHIGIEGYKHKHNTYILIVGGSGAGKTRTYGVPNVLECACSMVITDPKAEILRKTGNLLKQKGYEVIVFDLINPAASFCYNPFVYVHDDREVLTLIENLIQNTTPSHSKSSDPFWEKSETALLQALMLYLLHEAPPEEQNFSMVMEMIAAAEVHEDDDNYQSPLDILFERLEISPDHYGKIVDRVAEKAGIRKIHPHMFRHTFVSILLSNPDIGVATVAAEAGHAQPSTTLAIYTQVYHKRQDSIRSQMSETLYKRKTPER